MSLVVVCNPRAFPANQHQRPSSARWWVERPSFTTCFATHFCCNANRSPSMIKTHANKVVSFFGYDLSKPSFCWCPLLIKQGGGGRKTLVFRSQLPVPCCILGHQKCATTSHGTRSERRKGLGSYKHSTGSLCGGALLSHGSIEGPINSIHLVWLPSRTSVLGGGGTEDALGTPWGGSELTSRRGLLNVLADQRGRQVDGEGERGLLGVLDDNAGLADVLRHRVLVFCDRLCKSKCSTTLLERSNTSISQVTGKVPLPVPSVILGRRQAEDF